MNFKKRAFGCWGFQLFVDKVFSSLNKSSLAHSAVLNDSFFCKLVGFQLNFSVWATPFLKNPGKSFFRKFKIGFPNNDKVPNSKDFLFQVLEQGGTIDFPNVTSAYCSPLAKLLFRVEGKGTYMHKYLEISHVS